MMPGFHLIRAGLGSVAAPLERLRSLTPSLALAALLGVAATPAQAAPTPEPAEPTFVDGLSQSVFTRVSTEWINEEAWVESEVDSDRDGKPDLVHVDVSRVPETAAGRVALGTDVRIVLDAAPQFAIPATISFVASTAQFTKALTWRSTPQTVSWRGLKGLMGACRPEADTLSGW